MRSRPGVGIGVLVPVVVLASRTLIAASGDFDARRALAISYRPSATELIDLDGDEDLDLIVVCAGEFAGDQWNGSVLHVFENPRDGHFGEPVTYAVPSAPSGLAVADLDGDLDPDLVTANAAPDNLQVLLNDGDGGFSLAAVIPVGIDPVAVVAADFDGDGDIDLASADQFGFGISVAFNNGDATFPIVETHFIGFLTDSLQAGDLDDDGDTDILVFLNGTAKMLANDGSGGFGSSSPIGISAVDSRAQLCRFDADDTLDLVSGSSVWLGNGDGTFATPALATGMADDHVRCVDLNGDTFNDVVTGAAAALGDGDGMLGDPIDFDPPPDSGPIAVGDFDSDAIVDLVRLQAGVAGPIGFAVLLPGNGDGSVPVFPRVPAGDSVWSLHAADVNGDDRLDALVANIGTPFGQFNDGSVSVLTGNGDGTLNPLTSHAAGDYVRTVSTADLTGDNAPEMVVTNFDEHTASLFINDGGGGFGARIPVDTGDNPEAVDFADFDADGHLDIAVADYGLGATPASVTILFGDGTGQFSSTATINLTGHAAVGVVAVDLDGNTSPDLAIACAGRFFDGDFTNFGLYVVLNNGDGSFGSETSYATEHLPRTVSAADANLDGHIDLWVTANGPIESVLLVGEVTTFLNNGDGTFSSSAITELTHDHFAARAADLNDDGVIDLAVPYLGASVVTILWGDGTGGFAGRSHYATATEPRGIATGDFTGDGVLDLAIAHSDINELGLIVATSAVCEGDANGDGTVDPLDSGYVLARFGCPVGTGDPSCDAADQNGDGNVDPLDSGFILARFGECP
ncbi:MAG: VCBS repeat-containing protein [Planctomycetes bacterium]|nr:VCBS repeat-containing protein [Planctomycetota bacterium]